jgi:arylsulfatase A-like enzyme
LITGFAPQEAIAEVDRPNILVIMADDVAWASLGN